jgi:hypothetical protein
VWKHIGVCVRTHTLNVQCLRIFVVESCTTIVIHSSLKTSVFISYYISCFFFVRFFFFVISIFFFSLHPLPSFLNLTVLHYNIFYKGCIKLNWFLVSQLMHNITAEALYFHTKRFKKTSTGDLKSLCGTAKQELQWFYVEHSLCVYGCRIYW